MFFAIILAVIAIGLFGVYWFYPFIIYSVFPSNAHDYANTLPVVLASLSGIFFVYIAFLGQRWQMLYQQQEIRDNRTEMQNSTAQLKIQGDALTQQIGKMDRDFTHQNFFRILDQHFNTRDRVRIIVNKGERSFEIFFQKLIFWIDDPEGWHQDLDVSKQREFLFYNGFEWFPRRFGSLFLGNEKTFKLRFPDPKIKLNKNEIAFIIRAVMIEYEFETYLRSCYYLFDYMMKNTFSQYLVAVDAGMGTYERSFLFYLIATRFEVDGRIDLKHWLMDHRFLANIEPKQLLSPEHIELLYPIASDPYFKKNSDPNT